MDIVWLELRVWFYSFLSCLKKQKKNKKKKTNKQTNKKKNTLCLFNSVVIPSLDCYNQTLTGNALLIRAADHLRVQNGDALDGKIKHEYFTTTFLELHRLTIDFRESFKL